MTSFNSYPTRIELPPGHPLLSSPALRVFDGYPYLLTKVVPTLYHVILLPREPSPDGLRGIARDQLGANRLQTCLVLAEDLCLFLYPDGDEHASRLAPRGGILVTDRLLLREPLPASAELSERCLWLQAFLETGPRSGYLLGDLTKGGRPATHEDRTRLAGRRPDGVPNGLGRCPTCGEWRGECLDPSERFAGQLMQVHCQCENWNRCARCGGPLSDRRLNANYYNEGDGQIWHVPGFSAFSHRCSTQGRAAL